jgi:hypothetical protein
MHVFNVIRKAATVSASRMAVGQVGIITTNGPQKGQPLMRTAQGFVNLVQPSLYVQDGFGIEVDLLTTGEKVTITIGDEASDARLLEMLSKGQKINAIKERREVSGDGLKEAKDYVEALDAAARADGRMPKVDNDPFRF